MINQDISKDEALCMSRYAQDAHTYMHMLKNYTCIFFYTIFLIASISNSSHSYCMYFLYYVNASYICLFRNSFVQYVCTCRFYLKFLLCLRGAFKKVYFISYS